MPIPQEISGTLLKISNRSLHKNLITSGRALPVKIRFIAQIDEMLPGNRFEHVFMLFFKR